MITRAVLVVLFLAVSARFGLLIWGGYRNGRVKSGGPFGQFMDRQKQPRFYWTIMVVHAFVVTAFAVSALVIIFFTRPIS